MYGDDSGVQIASSGIRTEMRQKNTICYWDIQGLCVNTAGTGQSTLQ